MSTRFPVDVGLPDRLSDPARAWLADQIRSRVVGADPGGKGEQIFATPGPRLFAPDAPIRRVHSDASMFVGGLRALLLQSLHPLAIAGVAQHSDFRVDPWGRLQRTADFLATTTFGAIDQADQAIAVVKRVHERVVGTAADGRPYAANDPHLLHWVHLAETDSFLAAYQRYGSTRLTRAEADSYVRDAAVIASKLGVVDPPLDVVTLRAHLSEFRPELHGTRQAREAARFLLIEPPLPPAARPAYLALAASAVALLPVWTRWPLRLPFLPVSEKLVVGPAGALVTGVIRWSMRRPGDVPSRVTSPTVR
ncbi:MAG: oxygenase MpaB family protein [Ilumatobacteraceae bacterium]